MNSRERLAIDEFHKIYYDGLSGQNAIFANTYWMGIPCLKCPLDLWIYQEILSKVQPDLVIETGTYLGGSALFIAHLMDILGRGQVVTIDNEVRAGRPSHHRIQYVTGSSTDETLIRPILDDLVGETCVVILDADHSKKHVLQELRLLSPYVSLGSYLIVEDTNINGHPAFPSFGEGPLEAVQEFLKTDTRFIVDESCEKFLMTFNPQGYLKRVA